LTEVAIPIFERLTPLDAIGPYEVLHAVPDVEVRFVGVEAGPVQVEGNALRLVAEASLDELPRPDVVVVPGGYGTRPSVRDERLVEWLRAVHEHTRFTTSVCTGALLLGEAGILDGLEATTHWLQLETLRKFGATPSKKRVVEQGKVITAAGVSAGIDMALLLAERLAGATAAQAAQLYIEYDPEPPFDAGSPDKAPPEIVERLREQAARRAPAG
jgi:transcriptional regulator GlxA family with amidase domain